VSGQPLSVLVPAAGASRRLGEAKQLLQYRGETLIQRAIRLALSLQPVEIIVVTGANRDAVAAAVAVTSQTVSGTTSVLEVHNPEWDRGMGGSIARGAGALNADARGVLVLLCDQWRLRQRDLRRLKETWQADPSRIVCARTTDRYGPPVIFPAACFPQLRKLDGERGAREVISAHPELLHALQIPAAHSDLDTPSQLREMRASETEG